MKPSVLYAMASWSGPREGVKFDDTYVEKHIDQLKKVKHNLTQISIGNPENKSMTSDFKHYIKSLKDVSGVPVVVHNVKNIGRSYGQWARIYEKYRTQFDYYIFVEDDYQPVLDDFDEVLINMYEKKKCGFLCGLIFNDTGRYGTLLEEHAGITNGIASSKILEIVRENYCCLPHDMGKYSNGQILFSQGFTESGFKLGEYIDTGEYRSLYYDHSDEVRIYGPNKDAKDIFNPKQVIGKEDTFKYVHFKEDDLPPPPPSRRMPKSRVIGRRM